MTDERKAFLFLSAAGLSVVGIIAALVSALCDGSLVWGLDDPYIHLALAENIFRGHYGLNPGEAASPASSIAYPFLLAPFAAVPDWTHLAPLFWGCAAVVWFSLILARALSLAEVLDSPSAPRWIGGAFAVCLCYNLYGLVFTGLEHSIQAAALATVLVGLVQTSRTGRLPWWCVIAAASLPFIRFEMVVPAAAAIAAFIVLGRLRAAVGVSAFIAAGAATYAYTMISLGLPPIPSSVLVKSASITSAVRGDLLGTIEHALERMYSHARYNPMALFFFSTTLLVLLGSAARWSDASRRREVVAVSFLSLGALVARLNVGFFGVSMCRYDTPLLLPILISLLLVWAPSAKRLFAAASSQDDFIRRHAKILLAGIGVFFAYGCYDYGKSTLLAPIASMNIYEQQGQMSRFVKDYYKKTVAVNDLGYVAWRSPAYVLDLEGLGNDETRKLQQKFGHNPKWMSRVVNEHGAGLVMIYDPWFKDRPKEWVLLGHMVLGSPWYTPGDWYVSFYATPKGDITELCSELSAFSKTMPGASQFVLRGGCRPESERRSEKAEKEEPGDY